MFIVLGSTGHVGSAVVKTLLDAGCPAVAYHAHPLLGSRLAECTRTVLAVPDRSADKIFGSPDDIKFRSSMTLFDAVDAGGGPYRNALDRFYAGEHDAATLAVLDRWRAAG